MKEVKAYACDVCKKVYPTEKEAQQCEDRCNDRCSYKFIMQTNDNSEIEITYNYDYWYDIRNNDDKYLVCIDDGCTVLTGDELVKFIEED